VIVSVAAAAAKQFETGNVLARDESGTAIEKFA
jgi:hypothetical protein